MKKTYIKTLIFFAVLSAESCMIYSASPGLAAASVVWSATAAVFLFLMEKSGRVSLYRTIFFAVLSASFLLEMHFFFSRRTSFLPYCHISMSGDMMLLLYNQFLAVSNFTWVKYGALSIGILWLLVVLVNGGGFCSYVCFFGGIDNALSKILKKPLIRVPPSIRFREFQFAFFIFIVFISFLYNQPVFCQWVCPFKISNCILNPNSRLFLPQTIVFIVLGLVFLIILPVLTKKRFFCSLLCPFGALPPLVNKIIPYKITITKDSCTRCGKCRETCPSFAIGEKDNAPRITRFCTLCMECAGACPAKSIRPTIYNQKETGLVPLISMLLAGAISLFYVPQLIVHFFS